jgi:plastocyanin
VTTVIDRRRADRHHPDEIPEGGEPMRGMRTTALAAMAAAALGVGGMVTIGAAASGTTKSLKADTTKLAFSVKKITVAKPGKVTLKMLNPSFISHNVAISGKGLKKPVLGKVVGKGKTSTVTATLKKGTYTFFCSVDGHEAAGMKGTLVVK